METIHTEAKRGKRLKKGIVIFVTHVKPKLMQQSTKDGRDKMEIYC